MAIRLEIFPFFLSNCCLKLLEDFVYRLRVIPINTVVVFRSSRIRTIIHDELFVLSVLECSYFKYYPSNSKLKGYYVPLCLLFYFAASLSGSIKLNKIFQYHDGSCFVSSNSLWLKLNASFVVFHDSCDLTLVNLFVKENFTFHFPNDKCESWIIWKQQEWCKAMQMLKKALVYH